MRRAWRVGLIALAWLALSAPAAMAAERGSGFVFEVNGFYIIDFLTLVGILWYFLRGPAKTFIVKRHDAVRLEMEEAAKLKAEATERLERYEKMLSDLEGEIARLREEFRHDGEQEKARIEAEAEALAKRIRHDTAASLNRETTQLRIDLERELSVLALERAGHLVRERLDAETHQRLVRGFIDDLEQRQDLGSLSA